MTETAINKGSHIAQIEKALERPYAKSVSERLKTTAGVLSAVQSEDTATELLLSRIRKPVWEDTVEGDALFVVFGVASTDPPVSRTELRVRGRINYRNYVLSRCGFYIGEL